MKKSPRLPESSLRTSTGQFGSLAGILLPLRSSKLTRRTPYPRSLRSRFLLGPRRAPPAPGAAPSALGLRSPTHGTDSHLVFSPSSDGDRVPALGGWNPKKAPPPVIFEPGIHNPRELSQVGKIVWLQHGVTKNCDLSDRLPTCVSGHVLSRVEILEVSDPPVHFNRPKCCACSAALDVGNCAFTCYRCVKAYFLTLPVDRELAATGHSKGAILCPICAFKRRGAGRSPPGLSDEEM